MRGLDDYKGGRGSELERLNRELSAEGVAFAHIQFPTFPGALRSKLSPLGKALSQTGAGFNSAIFLLTHGDGNPDGDVVFESQFSSSVTGWPDILSYPDPDSVIRLPWRPATAAVILNTLMPDGSPCPLDVRALIADAEDRASELGFETRFAFEYEVFMFAADDEAIEEGRYEDLKPLGRDLSYCDHIRHPEFEGIAREFIERMSSIGIGVAGFHTEYGRGMAEFALSPQTALAAADAASRAKLYLAELCEERGLIATFMARCRAQGTESTSGIHVHQSLLHDDANAFAAEQPGELSETGRHYLGGMLETMSDLHLIFRPTVNSYRRMNPLEWSPVDVSWAIENRSAAVRAITRPAPGAVRLEHRVSGADANPYLVVAACLGGGLHGIEQRIEPPEPGTGSADDPKPRFEMLTTTLPDAIARFDASKHAEAIFGRELVEHYVTSRNAEWDAYQAWLGANVTEFEFNRYFEAH